MQVLELKNIITGRKKLLAGLVVGRIMTQRFTF